MFSAKDYIEGKEPPRLEREESGTYPMPLLRYFGVARNAKGRIYPFVVKEKGKVPDNCLEVHQCFVSDTETPQSIADRADRLVDKYEAVSFMGQNPQDGLEPPIVVGSITYHIDARGSHLALVLDVRDFDCKALFLTSNPLWNKFARLLTKDEISLAGLITKKKQTYFAPVIRAIGQFTAYESVSNFSADRVSRLLREFEKGFSNEERRSPAD